MQKFNWRIQVKLLEASDKERYKSFLEAHDRCNFQQSLEWEM